MQTPLAKSLAIQMRVIRALLMREVITRFGRENLGVLWLVLEPMLFTLGVAALWTAAGLGHGGGTSLPIISFAITGYSSVLMWRNTASKCNSAILQNFNLLYHRNVQVIDVFATRIILELSGATASFILLSTFFISLGVIKPPVDMLEVIGGWLMLSWFGASLGLLLGAATTYSELVDRIWHPVSYLLFPLSGAAFMVDWLPPVGRKVVLLLPMVHGVEMVREGFFGDTVRTYYDVGYMAMCCIVMNLIGLFLARDAERRIQPP